MLPVNAWALRCDSQVVSGDMTGAQIQQACGQPDAIYPLAGVPGAPDLSEQWVYNFGPHRLLYLLRLRAGRLVDERTDGYGFHLPAIPECHLGLQWLDHSLYRLLTLCGPPLERSGYVLYRRPGGRSAGGLRAILREELRYRQGGTHGDLLVYVVENAWVVAIQDE